MTSQTRFMEPGWACKHFFNKRLTAVGPKCTSVQLRERTLPWFSTVLFFFWDQSPWLVSQAADCSWLYHVVSLVNRLEFCQWMTGGEWMGRGRDGANIPAPPCSRLPLWQGLRLSTPPPPLRSLELRGHRMHWAPFPSAFWVLGKVTASSSCQSPSAISLIGLLSLVHTREGWGGNLFIEVFRLECWTPFPLGACLIPAFPSVTFYCSLLEICGKQNTFIRSPKGMQRFRCGLKSTTSTKLWFNITMELWLPQKGTPKPLHLVIWGVTCERFFILFFSSASFKPSYWVCPSLGNSTLPHQVNQRIGGGDILMWKIVHCLSEVYNVIGHPVFLYA